MGLFDKLLGRKAVDDDRLAQVMRAADGPAVLDPNSDLMASMIAGLGEQMRHAESLEEARGTETMVVRLVPQLPIRAGEQPRSWLGGGAALPADATWPEREGKRAMHLATICCSDLPAELWEGSGPRDGWLVVFMHASYDVEVLHVAGLGELRDSPEPYEGVLAPAHGLRHNEGEHQPIRAFPRWPIDLVAVGPDDPDPVSQKGNGREPLHAEYRSGYDVSTPAYRPFDWRSTFAMLDLLEAGVQQKSKVVHSFAVSDKIVEETRPVFAQAAAAWDAALPRIEHVARQLRTLAESVPFSDERIAPLLEQLHEIEWIEVRRPTASEAIPITLRVTEHHADASLWVHKYEAIRFDWAKHAYVADPSSLPPAVREHYEQVWRGVAAGELASMGNVPRGYVHDFDERADRMLLELPTSALMSWMFGDVDNVVLSLAREDLAAGAFDKLKVQWSN